MIEIIIGVILYLLIGILFTFFIIYWGTTLEDRAKIKKLGLQRGELQAATLLTTLWIVIAPCVFVYAFWQWVINSILKRFL